MIPVDFSHSSFEGHSWPEIRVDPSWTIEKLKDRVYIMCGTTPEDQILFAKDKITGNSANLDNDEKSLEWYGICHEAEIHITDTNPFAKEHALSFTDVTRVDKYVMSDEEYDKRKGTVREHFRKVKEQKALERAAQLEAMKNNPNIPKEPTVEEVKITHPVGSRCEVNPGGRRGEVKWVGEMKNQPDMVYIGVRLDEPTGKNDGEVKGVRYFDAGGSSYGCFQRPEFVTCGDFPELDPFADLDEF